MEICAEKAAQNWIGIERGNPYNSDDHTQEDLPSSDINVYRYMLKGYVKVVPEEMFWPKLQAARRSSTRTPTLDSVAAWRCYTMKLPNPQTVSR